FTNEYLVLVCDRSSDFVWSAPGLYQAGVERNQRRPGRVCRRGNGDAHGCGVPCRALPDRKLEPERKPSRGLVFGGDRRLRGSGDHPVLSAVSKGRAFVSGSDGACRRRGADGVGGHFLFQRSGVLAKTAWDSLVDWRTDSAEEMNDMSHERDHEGH